MMIENSIPFLATFFTGCVLIMSTRVLGARSGVARHLRTVQSAHVRPTFRIGGIAIIVGYIVMILAVVPQESRDLVVGLSLVPVFVIGLLEDLHVPMSPTRRLMAVWVGCVVQIWLHGMWMPRFDLPLLDAFVGYAAVGIPFTLLLVGGVSHAFNLVDGLHGLSSGTAILTSGALGVLALLAGDPEMAWLCAAFATVVAGFLVLNFPFGRIFLGDAGAYSVGFILGWFGILLVVRNPELSAWSVFLCFFWPIAEAFWSILRRKLKGISPARADRMHMHHIVLRGLEITVFGKGRRQIVNPVATLVLMPFIAAPMVVGVLLWSEPREGGMAAVAFMALFVLTYLALVRRVQNGRFRSLPKQPMPVPQ